MPPAQSGVGEYVLVHDDGRRSCANQRDGANDSIARSKNEYDASVSAEAMSAHFMPPAVLSRTTPTVPQSVTSVWIQSLLGGSNSGVKSNELEQSKGYVDHNTLSGQFCMKMVSSGPMRQGLGKGTYVRGSLGKNHLERESVEQTQKSGVHHSKTTQSSNERLGRKAEHDLSIQAEPMPAQLRPPGATPITMPVTSLTVISVWNRSLSVKSLSVIETYSVILSDKVKHIGIEHDSVESDSIEQNGRKQKSAKHIGDDHSGVDQETEETWDTDQGRVELFGIKQLNIAQLFSEKGGSSHDAWYEGLFLDSLLIVASLILVTIIGGKQLSGLLCSHFIKRRNNQGIPLWRSPSAGG